MQAPAVPERPPSVAPGTICVCRRPQLEALHVLEMEQERRAEFVLKHPRILQVRFSAFVRARQRVVAFFASCGRAP